MFLIFVVVLTLILRHLVISNQRMNSSLVYERNVSDASNPSKAVLGNFSTCSRTFVRQPVFHIFDNLKVGDHSKEFTYHNGEVQLYN